MTRLLKLGSTYGEVCRNFSWNIPERYNIADIAVFSWYGDLVLNDAYEASEFLDVASYKHVVRWASEIDKRPAVQRGQRVNKLWGPEEERVPERHSAADFD